MRFHLLGIGARIHARHNALRITERRKLVLLHFGEGVDAEGHDDGYDHPHDFLVVDAPRDDALIDFFFAH